LRLLLPSSASASFWIVVTITLSAYSVESSRRTRVSVLVFSSTQPV